MKEKDAFVDNKDHQLILYTEKDDNTYGPTQTGAVSSKDYIDDFRNKWKNMENSILSKILSGQTSMIYYYMMLEELTPSELALRVGLSKSKVEKHFHPRYFEKANVKIIRKYAEVFNVPVANLFQVISVKEDGLWKANYIENEEVIDKHCITQQKTENPLVIITKIEAK
jgi:hypothetical protein